MNPHINERSPALPPWGHLHDSRNLFLMASDSFFFCYLKGLRRGAVIENTSHCHLEDLRLSYKSLLVVSLGVT